MTSEKILNYKANRRKRIEELNIPEEELKAGSEEYELHHIIAKENSEETVLLCKPFHNFISLKQNSLSVKQRKNLLLLALKSILAWFELGCKQIRLIIEKMIEDGK